MLTPGNHKLGGHRIWGFGLPSGTHEVCPGLSDSCQAHCYAVTLERYRPNVVAKYQRNLALARRRSFVQLVRAFLVLHRVRVVRVHLGGDFFSVQYARKWLRIMQRSPRTLFYFYTRSWRVPAIKTVIDRMAGLPNCRVWYSVDRDTGLPIDVPPRARIAWLMTTPDDLPPSGTHLVFRVRRLRHQPASGVDAVVCPTEDGVARSRPITCDRCGYCWHPTPIRRIPLPVHSATNGTERKGGEGDRSTEAPYNFPPTGGDRP